MSEDAFLSGAAGRFAPGSRIAGYGLDELIGRGGMAQVFRARDEHLGRPVALKIIAPELVGDPASRRRFIREARATAAVHDPHIIPVFEAGEANGALFIAMPLVNGGDAATLVRQRGKLPSAWVAEIVSQIASALDAAHAQGLVHRDVKPANMLLDARPGRPDHIYLSDFGLTKAAQDSGGLTGSGQFLGTADYVAPEQIKHRDVDGRADQYALGCSAFELLCSEPPFRRDNGQATLQAHLSEEPPPVNSLRADLPTEVNGVFAKVLAKSPAERYPSCRDFADSLRSALGLPPYATATSTSAPEEQTTGAEMPPTIQGQPTGISAADDESASVETAKYAEGKPGMGDEDKTRENRPLSNADKIQLIIGLLGIFVGIISPATHITVYRKLLITAIAFAISAILLFVRRDTLTRVIKLPIWLVLVAVGLAAAVAVGGLVLFRPSVHGPAKSLPGPPPGADTVTVLMNEDVAAVLDPGIASQIYASNAVVEDARCGSPAGPRTWNGVDQIKARYVGLARFASLQHVDVEVQWQPDNSLANQATVTARTIGKMEARGGSLQAVSGNEVWHFARLPSGRWVITSFTYHVCLPPS